MAGQRSLEVSFRRGGRGDPLFLVHGLGLSLRTWLPVIPALEREHEVVALDLPGFGESPPLPPGQVSVASLADAVERLMDQCGHGTAHLAGNSLGGWVSLELARRGRARSVVAISPAGMWTGRESIYAHRNLWVQRVGAKRLAPHADALTRTAAGRTPLMWSAMSRPWRVSSEEAAYLIRAYASAPGWKETHAWTSTHSAQGLEDVRCPVAIVWGTLDTLLLPRQGPRFVRHLPTAELKRLPRLGHVPMYDDPTLVARTITDFTARAVA